MSLMSDIATAIKNKFILNDFYSQSNSLLTGGGTISVSATWEVKWSTRFSTVSNGRGVSLATGGYFDITMPAVSTVITGAGGATNKTVTANGIPLGAWETLYYILPLGATNTTVNANFRVCSYTADINIPNNWIKICSKNNDGGYVDFACGVSLRNNTSINTHLYDVKGADVDGAVSSANVLATARTIATSGDVVGTATSFNGSANITIPMTLANSGVTAGTYSKMTVDAKGRVTAGFTQTMEDIPDATFKRSVKAATTANITLSAPQTIDGVALVAGDRVLVKNQTTTSQNGIYVVAAAAWTRSLDADSASKIASALVAVDTGTVNGGKLFDNDFKITDTLGTTAMQWSMNLDDGSLLTSGSTSIGTVSYNGTTAVAGQFDGGTTTPTGTVRLNYGGYFYPSYINLTGSADTTITSSHVFVETGSDGYVRPKTLANFKTEMFASPTLVTPNIGVATGTSFNSITGLATVAPLVAGTATVGTSTLTARQDHIHPVQTSVTGNSGTATKLQTARTINGVAFDGSANITAPTNLGITAGTTAGPIVTSSTGTNATLPTASATASGVITIEAQTIGGIKTFSSSPVVPTPTATTQAANKAYVDSTIIDQIGLIDYGYVAKDYHIVAFGGEFNRADYPKLWAYLQANPTLVKTQAQWTTESTTNGGVCGFFSSGNGTTTFRVPNLDKAFLRADSRGVGSFQEDAIRNITGEIGSFYLAEPTGASGAFVHSPYGNTPAKVGVVGGDPGANSKIGFNASLVVPTAVENRPKNIAILPLIVAK